MSASMRMAAIRQALDIVDIPVLNPQPEGYQSENWLLDPEHYWRRVSRLPRASLPRLADSPALLWINGRSTYHGTNDKIPLDETDSLTDSLRLIRVERLDLRVFAPSEAFGNRKRRVQGTFVYAGVQYALWITDPDQERAWLAKDDGHYEMGECYLTISLGEPFNGACYKLIAAIIFED